MTEEAGGKHPLRCETCDNREINPNDDWFCKVTGEELAGEIEVDTHRKYGCASHSSAAKIPSSCAPGSEPSGAPQPAAAAKAMPSRAIGSDDLSSAEQRIKDVIAGLISLNSTAITRMFEAREKGNIPLEHELAGKSKGYDKAISLLRGDGKP